MGIYRQPSQLLATISDMIHLQFNILISTILGKTLIISPKIKLEAPNEQLLRPIIQYKPSEIIRVTDP